MRFKYLVFSISYFVLALTTYHILNTTYVYAASPSPSPNQALNDFQKKVEDLKKDAASKAAQLKTEVSKTIQNKSYIGSLAEVKGKQLVIQSEKGTRNVDTDEYTLIQDSSKRVLALKDLKIDDFLVALGDVDDNHVMKAKKVLRTKAPVPVERYVVWGQIQSILINTFSLLKNDNQKVTINTSGNTVFRLGNDEVTFGNLKTGNFVISVGSKLVNNSTNSQFVYLLNPKGELKIEKAASSSATPSATPKVR